MLEKIGIFGWDKIELAIFAAIVADAPICFIGDHGSMKTDGASLIAHALFGSECDHPNGKCIHREYPLPAMRTVERLLGFPDVRQDMIQNNRIEYLATPTSLHGAKTVMFDEPNRASGSVYATVMEAIRTRRIMGVDTKLLLVFAAMNPPETYRTQLFDAAEATRFVFIRPPSWDFLSKEAKQRALTIKSNVNAAPVDLAVKNGGDLRKLLRKARKTYLALVSGELSGPAKAEKSNFEIIDEIVKNMQASGCRVSTRQARTLRSLLLAADCLVEAGYKVDMRLTMPSLLIESVFPESFRVVIGNTTKSLFFESALRTSTTRWLARIPYVVDAAALSQPETPLKKVLKRYLSKKSVDTLALQQAVGEYIWDMKAPILGDATVHEAVVIEALNYLATKKSKLGLEDVCHLASSIVSPLIEAKLVGNADVSVGVRSISNFCYEELFEQSGPVAELTKQLCMEADADDQ